jgi:hypothetical protein
MNQQRFGVSTTRGMDFEGGSIMTKALWRSLGAVSLAIAALALWPVMASASSGAHFFHDTSASVAGSGALVVHIDEAGLGNENITYALTAEASATYACINGGGNHPKAANKETFHEEVSAGATFQVKNGRVEADMSAGPISAGSFKCPGGQTLVLAAVSYSNIVLTDTTNNVPDKLGSVSRTFFKV